MMHTVKGFSVVNVADGFVEFPCFFYDPMDVGNYISLPLPLLNPVCTSGSIWFTYC